LNASQRSLATTGHNIANVNNPDFSRQRVDLTTELPQREGRHFVGTGVQVEGIDRVYDSFLATQLRTHTSTVERFTALDELTGQLDSLVADPDASLAPSLEGFFAAAADLANDPASIPARQALLSNAGSLTARFQDLDRQMDTLRQGIDTSIRTTIAQVNGLAQSIAAANQDIVLAQGATGRAPADLLDHRDGLLRELSTQVAVQVVPDDSGAVNVFIGKGQGLVLAETAQVLVVDHHPFDPQLIGVRFEGQEQAADLSPVLIGGRIGGLLEFRDQILTPAQNRLGLLATGLGEQVNAIHQQGYDLQGAPGEPLFATAPARVLSHSGNSAGQDTVTVTITDTAALTHSDYELRYTGSGYSLRRSQDGLERTLSGAGPHQIDGLSIDIQGGTPVSGDRFMIQPTRNGAGQLELMLSDPRQLAAGLTPINPGANPPPIGVGLTSAPHAPGDNRNALALAGLQTQRPLLEGRAGYQEFYGQLVGEVGSQGQRVGDSLTANQVLLQQTVAVRESVSGVNLDEEAANLMRFQQA
ncbi:MAG: flagellar hook-associated protein FlgK, partial [Candidatus Competibacteraceae bacterium]|nr:flagellar hook-associated protein FlgK [Candidatus Competibacteraceae bacterium]